MACRKPAFEQSTTRPCRSSRRREGDRVEDEVEPAPALPRSARTPPRAGLPRAGPAAATISASSSLGQRLDVGLGALVQVGDREIGAERAKALGAAPGDRLVVGDAGDQALAALERDDGSVKHRLFSRRRPAPDRPEQTQRVTRDHQFLVGRHDIGLDPAGGGRDQRAVAPRWRLGRAPARARPVAARPRRGSGAALADAGREHEAVHARPWPPPGTRLAYDAVDEIVDRRAGRPASSLASRSRMSLLTPDKPLSPPSW